MPDGDISSLILIYNVWSRIDKSCSGPNIFKLGLKFPYLVSKVVIDSISVAMQSVLNELMVPKSKSSIQTDMTYGISYTGVKQP